MRIAALYDVHGNLPALEGVLTEVERVGVDRVVVGGDVLPGPMASETLARLQSLMVPTEFLRGNGDRETLQERPDRPSRVLEPLLRPIFDGVADLVVCGHTHVQFDVMVGRTRVVNAGSVGMPFGTTGAHWLLIDSGTSSALPPREAVEFRRTAYDLDAAAAAVRRTAFPQAEQFASVYILNPPDMLEAFTMYARASLEGAAHGA